MTKDQATKIAEEHIKWLRDNDRKEAADALDVLMGRASEPTPEERHKQVDLAARRGCYGT